MQEKEPVRGIMAGDKIVTVVDSIVFFAILAVAICRLFISESLYESYPMPGQNPGGGLPGFGGGLPGFGGGLIGFGSSGFMLTCNMLTFLASGLWLAVRFFVGGLLWFRTGLCMPGGLLLVAALVSVNRASNVNLAFSDSLNLLAAFVACLIMVQLLSGSLARRQVLLAVILALGGTLVFRCHEQKTELAENVRSMQKDYTAFMEANGLGPQSWQARQLEERVLSLDTGGYFPVSNTAASYLILAGGAAMALAVAGGKMAILASMVAFAVIGWGIVITDSNGGKVGLVLLIPTAVAFHFLRRVKNRKLLYAGFIFVILAGIAAVAGYGIINDRLPTSNLWIRWQYWQATAGMIADHWLTGVGPQNFGIYYQMYMNPAAPEVVKDPHCVALAILSQWGIAGFAAIVWAALAVVWHLVKPTGNLSTDKMVGSAGVSPRRFIVLACGLALCASIAYIASCDQTRGELPGMVIFYVVFTRAGVFLGLLVGIWFLLGYLSGNGKLVNSQISLAVLLASLAVFALHNTIDFAFFTPGVMFLFSLITALTLAVKNAGGGSDSVRRYEFGSAARSAAFVVIAGVMISWVQAGRAVYAGQNYLTKAVSYALAAGKQNRADMVGQAAAYARQASLANRFEPAGYKYAADLKATLWQKVRPINDSLFQEALAYLEKAATIDPANGSYYQNAGELCLTKLEASPASGKANLIALADNYLTKALALQPGDSDLLVSLAQTRVLQGDNEKARQFAQKALDIEKQCMDMQAKLFPHRKTLYPRLSQLRQEQAKEILAR